jgi:hypothetical protein
MATDQLIEMGAEFMTKSIKIAIIRNLAHAAVFGGF